MTAKATRSCFTSADGFSQRTVSALHTSTRPKQTTLRPWWRKNAILRRFLEKILCLPFMLEWLWIKACLLLYRATQCLIKVATRVPTLSNSYKNHCFVTVPKGFYCRRGTKQTYETPANLKKPLSSASQISRCWRSVSCSPARHQQWLHVKSFLKMHNITAG